MVDDRDMLRSTQAYQCYAGTTASLLFWSCLRCLALDLSVFICVYLWLVAFAFVRVYLRLNLYSAFLGALAVQYAGIRIRDPGFSMLPSMCFRG